MIVSASRRTDIPAFYFDWFCERLRNGYVDVLNPFNRKQVSRSLSKPAKRKTSVPYATVQRVSISELTILVSTVAATAMPMQARKRHGKDSMSIISGHRF